MKRGNSVLVRLVRIQEMSAHNQGRYISAVGTIIGEYEPDLSSENGYIVGFPGHGSSRFRESSLILADQAHLEVIP